MSEVSYESILDEVKQAESKSKVSEVRVENAFGVKMSRKLVETTSRVNPELLNHVYRLNKKKKKT